jgi:hypothetical protein
VLGQVFVYKHAAPVLRRLGALPATDEASLSRLIDHVVHFSLAGIAAASATTSTRRTAEEGPPMNRIAIKMLVGDPAKYFGILLGITFAALLITQQASIFLGLMSRTFAFVTDTSLPDLWITDPEVKYIDELEPMQVTALDRVRGVPGVAWAVPMYKSILRGRLHNGTFRSVIVVGLDDATLIGGPPKMVEGELADLRRADGIILDVVSAKTRLASWSAYDADGKPAPGATLVPMRSAIRCRSTTAAPSWSASARSRARSRASRSSTRPTRGR